jgi:hypothetical protein
MVSYYRESRALGQQSMLEKSYEIPEVCHQKTQELNNQNFKTERINIVTLKNQTGDLFV